MNDFESWRLTFIIFAAVSAIITLITNFHDKVFITEFLVTIFYIPTIISLAVYLFLIKRKS